MPHKTAAYDLCKHLESDVRNRLLDPDTTNDVVDVAKALAESHTPGWLYYYLMEVEQPPNTGKALARLIDDDTIHETAERYADADGPIINLSQPAEYDWMREDPMKSTRNAYEQKLDDIEDALTTAYEDIIGDDLPHFDDPEFLEWLVAETVEEMNLLKWAVYEEQTRDRDCGATDPTQTVAEWAVKQTHTFEFVAAIATYETRDVADHDTYFDACRRINDEIGAYDDHYVTVDLQADPEDREMPLISLPLPDRDIPREVLDDPLAE